MAGGQPARGGARQESIWDFMERRGREAVGYSRAAEAAAYAAVKKAIRTGQDYRLMTPSEVMAYGNSLMRAAPAKPTRDAPGRPPAQAKQRGLDDSRAAKAVGGTVAYAAGLAPGAARGAWHTLEGAVETAALGQRLMDPLDLVRSPPGQSAAAQILNLDLALANYAVERAQHPSRIRDDLATAFQNFRVRHDPTATPVADTLGGEMKRSFELGMNGGELGFDGASLFFGSAAMRGAAGLGRAAKAANATERAYFAANPGAEASFARMYPKRGMSHHIVPRNATLPEWLGGGPYPKSFIESEFNKIRHDGEISVRDVYRNHRGAGGDGHFTGGAIPREFGGGRWKAADLGWDTYGVLDRLNYGTSPSTKAVVGPTLVSGVSYDALRPEEP